MILNTRIRKTCLAIAIVAAASWGGTASSSAADGDEGKVEVGKQAPDFVMTGIDGKEFRLSDKIGKENNVVLMFSRANW